MKGSALIRLGLVAIALAAAPACAQPVALDQGFTLEAIAEGHLDTDRTADRAFVAVSEDARILTVVLSAGGRSESVALEPTQFGPARITIDDRVLTIEDMTGGTTAISAIRRYRFDRRAARMRLIGIDATLYSRTFAHDGFEASWNLLTGDAITQELRLNRGGGDAAYDTSPERRFKRRSEPVYLDRSPPPEDVMERLRGG